MQAPPRMNFVQRAFARAARMVFPQANGYSQPGGLYRLLLPQARFDYEREVGDVWRNSAVAVGLGFIADNFAEAELQVTRQKRGGKTEPNPNHPLLQLLENPNDDYDSSVLWTGVVLSLLGGNGNGYWLKARGAGGYGRPKQLWYLPHFMVAPQWSGNDQFITHYLYRVDGRDYRIEKRDIIHFRYGVDLYNLRSGRSRLQDVLREVFTDNEAATYEAALLRNFAVPGLMITPGDPTLSLSDPTAKGIKEKFREEYSGEGRGTPLVFSDPLKAEKISFSPEELALDKLRKVPEARICAALGLPPQVIGLTSGEDTKTYANMDVAQRMAYHNCLIPLHKRIAKTLTKQLLPDLGNPLTESVCWCYDDVQAMREDAEAVFKRYDLGVRGGWVRVSEAKEAAGLEWDETDEVYLRPAGVTAVKTADEEPEPVETPETDTAATDDTDAGGDDSGDDGDGGSD